MVLFHRAAVGGVLALLIRAELFQPGLQPVKPEFFGHPEVYIIMILPAFGIISQIVPAFARKQLFGDASIVYATASIATSKRLLS